MYVFRFCLYCCTRILFNNFDLRLKQNTEFTAADWIRNYILLEAKVMLKSSALNMGQISSHLNFPSQSFFAKFFKNATGMTPKQYRNTPE